MEKKNSILPVTSVCSLSLQIQNNHPESFVQSILSNKKCVKGKWIAQNDFSIGHLSFLLEESAFSIGHLWSIYWSEYIKMIVIEKKQN